MLRDVEGRRCDIARRYQSDLCCKPPNHLSVAHQIGGSRNTFVLNFAKSRNTRRRGVAWSKKPHDAAHIRLNTELVKKPKDLVEYVIVHEMVHLIEPTHSARFVALLDEHYPTWRDSRAELNDLPLGEEQWPAMVTGK